jgi:hypothetical protein
MHNVSKLSCAERSEGTDSACPDDIAAGTEFLSRGRRQGGRIVVPGAYYYSGVPGPDAVQPCEEFGRVSLLGPNGRDDNNVAFDSEDQAESKGTSHDAASEFGEERWGRPREFAKESNLFLESVREPRGEAGIPLAVVVNLAPEFVPSLREEPTRER